MAQSEKTTTAVDMAALRQKQSFNYDLMRPGPGTPWEDRGVRGTVSAFFATCRMSMGSPRPLFDAIRRPETATDVRTFTIACGVLWGLGWVSSGAVYFFLHHNDNVKAPIDPQYYFMGSALQLILGTVAIWFAVKLAAGIYTRMAAGEATNLQGVLVTNLFAYSLGPSLLALIPYFGPPLALLWFLFALMVAGRTRLYLSLSSAIVDALMSTFAPLLIFVVLYFFGNLAWKHLILP